MSRSRSSCTSQDKYRDFRKHNNRLTINPQFSIQTQTIEFQKYENPKQVCKWNLAQEWMKKQSEDQNTITSNSLTQIN